MRRNGGSKMLAPAVIGKKSLSADLPPTLHDEMFLSAKQAAAFLGVSLATVRRLDWAGKLPFVSISERRRAIRVADLKALAIRAG
jgi:excisionase family DNA binding protein